MQNATLSNEMMPELLAGSSVFIVRNHDFDFSAIFRGYLISGGLEICKLFLLK